MKKRLIFHLDFNLIESLLDYFSSLQALRSVCLCGGGWGCGRGLRDADVPPYRKAISNSSLKEIISQSD